jgi:hypothetical protein
MAHPLTGPSAGLLQRFNPLELRGRLDRAAEPPPLLHPNMADLYREKVTQLAQGLQHDESRTGAAEALRSLVNAIILTPEAGGAQNRASGQSGGDAQGRRGAEDRRAAAATWNVGFYRPVVSPLSAENRGRRMMTTSCM